MTALHCPLPLPVFLHDDSDDLFTMFSRFGRQSILDGCSGVGVGGGGIVETVVELVVVFMILK